MFTIQALQFHTLWLKLELFVNIVNIMVVYLIFIVKYLHHMAQNW